MDRAARDPPPGVSPLPLLIDDRDPELLQKLTGPPWSLSCELAERLIFVARKWNEAATAPIAIISGYRTPERQRELIEEGRPAAPVGLSTHTTCPATGADLRIPHDSVAFKWFFGATVEAAGLRWGGGSPKDDIGIPSDWNHVDLGPRAGSGR